MEMAQDHIQWQPWRSALLNPQALLTVTLTLVKIGIMLLLLTFIYSQMSLCFQAKNNSVFNIY